VPSPPDPIVDVRDLLAPRPRRTDHAIGVIGAGFIVKDVHLVAYRQEGFHVEAIASRTPDRARSTAEARGIPTVHETISALLADSRLDIIDVAVPPHAQGDIIREALTHDHVRGILAQKPLATSYAEAVAIVRACAEAEVPLAVNQNMRFDHSMRALKALLVRGDLGERVLATIEMRAVPHWQDYLEGYDRLTLLNMSIHHLDVFRYLFGEPERVFASVRTDPRTAFAHRDGIALSILEYADGLRATAWDDVWVGPDGTTDRGDAVRWRVEGTEGIACGTIGWPGFPERVPSTIDVTSQRYGGGWHRPRWPHTYFPDAFAGPMLSLMRAIEEGGPVPDVDGRDNLGTMALVEACYRSLEGHRAVWIEDVIGD
jgi:predicted dehydrogenase